MNALTSALQVLIKSVWYKCNGWPVIMLGIDANGNPQPIGVGTPSGSGGGGIPFTPPTVNGVQVVGIQEVDNSSTVSSPTGASIAAGGLSWAFIPSSDFVGTLKLGTGSAVAWTGAMGSASRDAQPGNTLPGATITCSAGSYIILEGRP